MQVIGNKKKNRYLDYSMGLLGILILIGMIMAGLSGTVSYEGFHIDQCHKIKGLVTVSWGNQKIETTLPATINNADMEPIYISMVLHKKELGKGDSILFRNRQSHVRVYMDEVLIFDSGEAFDSPFSMGYGSLWKSLPLGDDYDGKTLTIELQPGYKMQAVSGYLPSIYFGTQASFIAMIMEKEVWVLVLTMILILLGSYDIVNGLFVIHRKKADQMFFLGLFSVDTGLWILIESHVLELFMSNMQIVTYLNYFTYGMMPVLLIRCLLSFEEFENKRYLKTICLTGILVNLIQFFMAATGICSQFESEWMNRAYLGLTVFGLLAALISIRKVEKEQSRRKLYSGIFILIISTILELMYFLFINKENSGKILLVGICLFIFKAGTDLIREGRKLRRDDLEKEILQTMAYTDGMTQLGNRFAYEQEKNRLEKKENTEVTILIADMNGLKRANDRHGHSYGDQIICRTAQLLEASFHDVGKCFRIGGDEFCVLAENADHQLFEECINTMHEKAAQLQESINDYGIASGVARGKAQDIEDIFHKADNLMYDCKKEMKGVRI